MMMEESVEQSCVLSKSYGTNLSKIRGVRAAPVNGMLDTERKTQRRGG